MFCPFWPLLEDERLFSVCNFFLLSAFWLLVVMGLSEGFDMIFFFPPFKSWF